MKILRWTPSTNRGHWLWVAITSGNDVAQLGLTLAHLANSLPQEDILYLSHGSLTVLQKQHAIIRLNMSKHIHGQYQIISTGTSFALLHKSEDTHWKMTHPEWVSASEVLQMAVDMQLCRPFD
jgi:hypothetical protein